MRDFVFGFALSALASLIFCLSIQRLARRVHCAEFPLAQTEADAISDFVKVIFPKGGIIVPRKTWAGLVVLAPIFVWALHFIALEAVGTAALDSLVESGLGFLGLEKSRVSTLLAPYVIPGFIAALCLFAAFKLGEYERTSYEPKADIDPRLAFERIRKSKKWVRKYTEPDAEKRMQFVSNYLDMRLDHQIHDALVQGRLWAWGQKNLAGFEEGPFDRIPAEKWHDMEIVFTHSTTGARALTHTRVSKAMAYLGIKLNAKQIAKEFQISKRALR